MIVIVDYGMGNLASIANMIKHVGGAATISKDVDVIASASKLILPGVGAFDVGMDHVNRSQLRPILEQKVLVQKTPLLGICLGMQLLTERSEEGDLKGLGWIRGETVRFHFTNGETSLRVPHMGWNTVTTRQPSRLTEGLSAEPRFYFVHAYHVVLKDESDILGVTHYGKNFTSMVQRGNIFGTQFHPEKSHRFGMQILKNFVEMA